MYLRLQSRLHNGIRHRHFVPSSYFNETPPSRWPSSSLKPPFGVSISLQQGQVTMLSSFPFAGTVFTLGSIDSSVPNVALQEVLTLTRESEIHIKINIVMMF